MMRRLVLILLLLGFMAGSQAQHGTSPDAYESIPDNTTENFIDQQGVTDKMYHVNAPLVTTDSDPFRQNFNPQSTITEQFNSEMCDIHTKFESQQSQVNVSTEKVTKRLTIN